jgi:magnesium transporter
MITIYSYDIARGALAQPAISELPELLEAENVDIWVDLESPDAKEQNILRDVFGFHELAIEDCTQSYNEEPKLDDYEDYLFLVIHSVYFMRDDLTFDVRELDLFFGKNYVVTYHAKPTFGINRLKRRLETNIDFMGRGTDEIFHAIIDSLVDNYLISFKQIERAIYAIESEILSNPTERTFSDLFKLKIGLINLRRVLGPGEEVMQNLGENEHELIQEENKVYFQDVHDHISNITGLLNSYMEMVSSTMDNYVSLTTYRMNSVMQTLTILATLVLVPTLIASLYGMNLRLPLQDSPFGFPIVLGFNVLISGLMFWYFKKKDWL